MHRGNTYARPVGGLIRTRADRERRWEARHLYTTKLDLRPVVDLRLSYPRDQAPYRLLRLCQSIHAYMRVFERIFHYIFPLSFSPPPLAIEDRLINILDKRP